MEEKDLKNFSNIEILLMAALKIEKEKEIKDVKEEKEISIFEKCHKDVEEEKKDYFSEIKNIIDSYENMQPNIIENSGTILEENKVNSFEIFNRRKEKVLKFFYKDQTYTIDIIFKKKIPKNLTFQFELKTVGKESPKIIKLKKIKDKRNNPFKNYVVELTLYPHTNKVKFKLDRKGVSGFLSCYSKKIQLFKSFIFTVKSTDCLKRKLKLKKIKNKKQKI